jgi:hypothetical protein
MGQPADEGVAVVAVQVVLLGEVVEDAVEVRADVLQARERDGAGDVDGAEVTCPRVDVAEQVPVERLEVIEVVPAVDAVASELVPTGGDDLAFGTTQIGLGRATDEVAQDTGRMVEVGIVGQGR